jgi:hypothetical protein
MHYKHYTFRPVFPVICEDIAVLFQKDVRLVQYDALAALKDELFKVLEILYAAADEPD